MKMCVTPPGMSMWEESASHDWLFLNSPVIAKTEKYM